MPGEAREETRRDGYVTSERFTERLAELLGHPLYDSHGHPIPKADGTLPPENFYLLSDAEAGQRLRIRRVSDDSASRLAYLWERGLVPGRELEVTEVRTLDGVVTVRDEYGISHALGGPLACSVFVQGSPEPARG
ncbi:MAG: metal-dependent transcriptional regulator [Actinobacteria bacterium]|nr:metal-dependent transcriptional regulator [Actinomycetota bacterium]